ncbi:MAG: methionyl-tRNA formyltransferase, partial [Labilithrix sp.]|nr:methionyl-tRNA formyltransferase [Labilithrix sp.]
MKPLRVAFFGSPEFALPTFEALSRQHDVVVVVSQPDRPAGRGLGLRRPAIAAAAVAAGLPLLQPRKVKRNEELLAHLASLDLDVGVTAAYGRILPPE